MAPAISLKQWPCCIIFIELGGVGFWIWKGLHVIRFLLLFFIWQMDTFRAFLCWQSYEGEAQHCWRDLTPTLRSAGVGVHALHRWHPQVGDTPSCALSSKDNMSAVFQAQVSSLLHPSYQPLSSPLGFCSLEKPSLTFILKCSMASLPRPGRCFITSYLKPCLPLHLLELLSSLSSLLLQEKEAAHIFSPLVPFWSTVIWSLPLLFY